MSDPQGRLEPGNIDLTHRPRLKNADGSISTVRSISVNIDGKEVLLPTVSEDGKILSNSEAVAQYQKTGKHLGIFDSPDAATAYAQQLHESQARSLMPQTDKHVNAALGDEDYQQLMKMSLSPDATERSQASALAKKLTPDESAQFGAYQKAHPAGSELHRADNNVLGMPPELAAVSALGVGSAMAAKGLSTAARVVAGGKSLVSQAAPVLKYELTKTGLQALGVSPSLATAAGMIVSGMKGGKAAPAAAEAAAESAPIEAVSVTRPTLVKGATRAVPRPMPAKSGNALNDAMGVPTETPGLKSGAFNSAMQDAVSAKTGQPLGQAITALTKQKFTAAEISQGIKWLQQGVDADTIAARLVAMRSASGSGGPFAGLPSNSEVSSAVAARNASGRWSK